MRDDPPKKVLDVEEEASQNKEQVQEEVKPMYEQAMEGNPNMSISKATYNTTQEQTAKQGQISSTTNPTYDQATFDNLMSAYGGYSKPRMADPSERKYYTREGRKVEAALTPQTEIDGVNSIYDVYADGYTKVNGLNKRALKSGFGYDEKGNIVDGGGQVVFNNVPNRYGDKDVDYLMDKLKKNKLTKAEYEALNLRKQGLVQGLANLISSLGDAAVATPMKGRDVAPVNAKTYENPYYAQADAREAQGIAKEQAYLKHLADIEKENRDKVSKAMEGSKGTKTDKVDNSLSQTNKVAEGVTVDTKDHFTEIDQNIKKAKNKLDRDKLNWDKQKETPYVNITLNNKDGKPVLFRAKKLVTKNGDYRQTELDQSYNSTFAYLMKYYTDAEIRAFYDQNYGVNNWEVVPQKHRDGSTYNLAVIKGGKKGGNSENTNNAALTNDMKLRMINFALQGASRWKYTDEDGVVKYGDQDAFRQIGDPIELEYGEEE